MEVNSGNAGTLKSLARPLSDIGRSSDASPSMVKAVLAA
jgi:hypothetical protein